jgi:hypothetical protein
VTIAACYLSPEGIVLGADSTSTFGGPPDGYHYFSHAQKIFEIGENGTIGVVTWGLGGLAISSHRMLFALLADDLKATPPTSMFEVADRWSAQYWTAYNGSMLAPAIQQCVALAQKPPFDATRTPADPNARTAPEESEFQTLRNQLTVGFCIGGYVLPSRVPEAFVVVIDPAATARPTPQVLSINQSPFFWGAPNIIMRLMWGYDGELRKAILSSGQWNGTEGDLDAILYQQHLSQYQLMPIRDAIDFVYSSCASTIKALKFSNLSQTCGGPIEIAVITSDRNFRWVRHKGWDIAIKEGDP